MKKVQRQIASVIVISADNKFLFAKKHAHKGGSYRDVWHIIGGGQDPRETLEQAARREALEEAELDLSDIELIPVGEVGYGESEKMQDGEKVLAKMRFHRFEARLPQNAADVKLPESTDEFAQFRWVEAADIVTLEQIPGAKGFWAANGYIQE